MTARNNRNLQSFASALELDEREIVEIMAAAGVTISRNRAGSWRRSPEARTPGGGARYSEMTDAEFDAFCAGFRVWWREQEDAEK